MLTALGPWIHFPTESRNVHVRCGAPECTFSITRTRAACSNDGAETGVWGGLWTPPERPREQGIEQISCELGIDPGDIARTAVHAEFRHTFTHFHLDIEPVYVEVSKVPVIVGERDHLRWHKPGDTPGFGLSAPAVKLLEALEGTER